MIDVMRQTACLVVNSIKVNNFATLFNYTTMDRAADSVTAKRFIDGSWLTSLSVIGLTVLPFAVSFSLQSSPQLCFEVN